MNIIKVINHEWTDVMSDNKVKLIRCTCCNPPRYVVLKGNMPLISTYYKQDALSVYFYEKSKGGDEDVF